MAFNERTSTVRRRLLSNLESLSYIKWIGGTKQISANNLRKYFTSPSFIKGLAFCGNHWNQLQETCSSNWIDLFTVTFALLRIPIDRPTKVDGGWGKCNKVWYNKKKGIDRNF